MLRSRSRTDRRCARGAITRSSGRGVVRRHKAFSDMAPESRAPRRLRKNAVGVVRQHKASGASGGWQIFNVMSLPEPETEGHASAQGARVALERGEVQGAIEHLAFGLEWTAGVLFALEARVTALEDQTGDQRPPVDFGVE